MLRTLRLARVLLACLGLLLLAEHAVRSDLDPRQHVISEYANGPQGWMMRFAFALWTASLLATAQARAGLHRALLLLAALGAMAAGLWRTQAVGAELPPERAVMTGGHLHNAGGEMLLVGIAGSAMLVIAGRDAVHLRRPAWALGLAAAGVDLVLLIAGDPAPGLRQRVVVAAALCWQWLLSGGSPKPRACPHRGFS